MNVVEMLDFNAFEKQLIQKKVCAYARVSSISELQETSILTQVETYTKLIKSHQDWEFVGVFTDHGKSGTSIKERDQFNLMIQIAKTGNIDKIITKSISRFARNTIDCLATIQELQRNGTEVWFENENISSLDPKIEFVISIMAGMAQEESRNISDNVKWGARKRFREGKVPMVTSKVLGYERNSKKEIVINEPEASIVKMIFKLYIDGHSQQKIADKLNIVGYRTKTKGVKYYEGAVLGILNNEKYTGNSILQKTTNKAVGSKVSIRNQSTLPKYYVENSHPGIITQEEFELAQQIKNKKILKYNKTLDKKSLSIMAKTKTEYQKVLMCGKCGKHYQFKTNNKGTKYERTQLQCGSNRNKKVCDNEPIFTELFDEILQSILTSIIHNKKEFLNSLSNELRTHPEVFTLEKVITNTTERLTLVTGRIQKIARTDSEFDITLKQELLKEENILESTILAAKNKLKTTHNVEALLLKYKKLLKSKDIQELKELFDNIIIHNRNEIDFVIDPLNSETNRRPILLFNTLTAYKFRNSNPRNTSRVIIK